MSAALEKQLRASLEITPMTKIVSLSPFRRKAQSNKAKKVQLALMVEEIVKDLSEVDRLFAEDAAQLTEASTLHIPEGGAA